ncbi:hypothetical protein BXY85_0237 [Roseivirga pacifica]|uniref:Uncharacterized protein n=1 Tax=Roseivirga pacifica TaxID=1267423 RepID=A0A1I0R952_9BACT|nr:hypothetical protein [Roseivirga pacifica]RKQ49248.1 hypothetical protein BXY85_0237 [Roseivirga pacifica]SEW37339.1 hypothetical protein SAMN05216290_3290 [Roseivirga pacifica]
MKVSKLASFQLSLFSILLWTSCISDSNKEESLDTKTSSPNTEINLQVPQPMDDSESHTGEILIEKINYLETGEIFITLDFKDWNDRSFLDSKSDSIISDKGFAIRNHIPFDIGIEYLETYMIDGISLFSAKHEMLGKAQIARFEKLDGLVTDYIAVLKSEQQLREKAIYGINGPSSFIANFESFKSEISKTRERELKFTPKAQRKLSEVNIPKYNMSLIFSNEVNKDLSSTSKILKLNLSDENMLGVFRSKDIVVLDLTPLPVQVNQYPLILLRVGRPSSDLIWDTPAVFHGNEYKMTGRIVELEKF